MMTGNRIIARIILPVLGGAALLASIALPLWVPAVRKVYRQFTPGGLLLGLALLAVLTLVVHLSSRRFRLLTLCVLLSLFLHMGLVMFFGVVDFAANPMPTVPRERSRREIAFGTPSLLETDAREAVRDQRIEMKTVDARTFENRAKPRPPSDAQVTKKLLPQQPAKQAESLRSLVPAQPASRPDLRVEDRIKTADELSADVSTPHIAPQHKVELVPVEAVSPRATRELEAVRTATRLAETKTTPPRPMVPEKGRDPRRDALDTQPQSVSRLQVQDDLRQTEVRNDTDRLSMPSALSVPQSSPLTRQSPDPQRPMDSVRTAADQPTVQTRPERTAQLKLDAQRATRLAQSDPSVLSKLQPQSPDGPVVRADLRRLSDEPVRMGSTAVSIDAPHPTLRSAAGPSGDIPAPARSRASPDAGAGSVARPTAQSALAATAEGRGSLVADRLQALPSRANATASPVNEEVARLAALRDPAHPLRGVASSADLTETEPAPAESTPTARTTGRAFEIQSGRGELSAPEAGLGGRPFKTSGPVKMARGGGEIQETLAEREVAPLSGGASAGVESSRETLQGTGRRGEGDRQPLAGAVGNRALPASQAELRDEETESASGAPGGSEKLVLKRSGTGGGETGPVGAPPAAPKRAEGGTPKSDGSWVAQITGFFSAGSDDAPVSGADLKVDASGAGRSAHGAMADIMPGTIRGESPSADVSANAGGALARRGVSTPESWSSARTEAHEAHEARETPISERWRGAGSRQPAPASQPVGTDAKLVMVQTGVSSGRPVLSDYEPDSAAASPSSPMKNGVVGLPFNARTATESVSRPGAAKPSAETGGVSRDVAVNKATSGMDSGAVVKGPSRSMTDSALAGSEAPRSSRLMTWFAGMSGEGKVEVPDTLPRGERLAAYRSVSAAEMRSTPKLQRQKLIYSLRSPEKRQEHILELGGSAETEKAVERALAWLVRAQSDDGRWSVGRFKGADECGGVGDRTDSDSAVTGLALLAYLGAGYTHTRGDYRETVRKGLKWLIAGQTTAGDLRRGGNMYAQAMASAALCEAYSLSEDQWLFEPARRAVQFICDSQNLGAGWRYEPRTDNDTSVTGWMVLALKSGEFAGFPVNPQHFRWTGLWLDQVRRGKSGGLYAYKEGHGPTPIMTAEGWFCQLFMGEQVRTRGEGESASYLMENRPVWDPATRGVIHFYYWYYATLALHLSGSEAFEPWNRALREALLSGQRKEGPADGSWDPVDPLGERGGRVYSTTMATLCLEVYYRYLPFYRNAPSDR
jgi:hypothetical protein